jgi:molybdopterin-synthase adenylyltransferase
MSLTDPELERYSHQLSLPGWSPAIQERLKAASAIVVGAGALGSPVATYLAAAGVGRIGIVDPDPVDLASLNRHTLHWTPDIGRNRAQSASVKLDLLNPEGQFEPYPVRLEEANAEAIVAGADVVADCSESVTSRYLVNDVCCAVGVPLVEASVLGLSGLVMSIRPGQSACYRCAFPAPPSANVGTPGGEASALGAMAGVVGSVQALEALKLLTGTGEPLLDRILELDGRDMTQTLVAAARRAGCQACAEVAASRQSG